MIHVSLTLRCTTQPKLVVYSQRHITLLLPTNIHFQKIFEYRTALFARQVELKLLNWTKIDLIQGVVFFSVLCHSILGICAITQFTVFLVINNWKQSCVDDLYRTNDKYKAGAVWGNVHKSILYSRMTTVFPKAFLCFLSTILNNRGCASI